MESQRGLSVFGVVASIIAIVVAIVSLSRYTFGLESRLSILENWKNSHSSHVELTPEQFSQFQRVLSIDHAVSTGSDEAPGSGTHLAHVIPIGSVVAWPGPIPQDEEWKLRWQVCDGSTVKNSKELWFVLQPYQEDGLTEESEFLKLPDFRGYFLRGLDQTRRVDLERRVLGESQSASLENHVHELDLSAWETDGHHFQPISGKSDNSKTPPVIASLKVFKTNMDDEDEAKKETRPANYAVHWVMKIAH
ncbi:MAG: hypothetical protein NCW75_04470 [Phycisphaera sp.]|nr:MAG: hypothetical protein NCW75_04470 [Phycisphaera sp.]